MALRLSPAHPWVRSIAPELSKRQPLKFRNQPCEVEGIRFSSKREARRYCELIILQRAGKIRDLVLQPAFPLYVGADRLGEYRADFAYIECETNRFVVEDAKGVRTPLYAWKVKHLKAQYGIDVVEV